MAKSRDQRRLAKEAVRGIVMFRETISSTLPRRNVVPHTQILTYLPISREPAVMVFSLSTYI
jgi:hypothetical protein